MRSISGSGLLLAGLGMPTRFATKDGCCSCIQSALSQRADAARDQRCDEPGILPILDTLIPAALGSLGMVFPGVELGLLRADGADGVENPTQSCHWICFGCLGETSECRRHAAFSTARCVFSKTSYAGPVPPAARCRPCKPLLQVAIGDFVSRDRSSAETAAFLSSPLCSFVHFGWSHRRVAFPLPAGGQPEGLAPGCVLHDTMAGLCLKKNNWQSLSKVQSTHLAAPTHCSPVSLLLSLIRVLDAQDVLVSDPKRRPGRLRFPLGWKRESQPQPYGRTGTQNRDEGPGSTIALPNRWAGVVHTALAPCSPKHPCCFSAKSKVGKIHHHLG